MPNPWDSDPIVSGGPVYGAPPKADPPPSGYAPADQPVHPLTYVPGGPADPARTPKTTYRTLTPQEIQQHGLPPASYQVSSDGKIEKVADAGGDTKAAQRGQAMEASQQLLQSIEKARGYVNDSNGPLGNTATGLGYNLLHHSPVPTNATALDSTVQGEIQGNIFKNWMASMKAATDTGGSAFGGRIMQSEIPFIVNSLGTLKPGNLTSQQFLGNLDQVEQRVLRSTALLNNENPDDPAVIAKYRLQFTGDSTSKGVNDAMRQMYHSGAPIEKIVAFGRQHGVDPNPEQLNLARQKGMDVQFVQPQPPQQGQPQGQPQGLDQQRVSQPGIGQQLVDNTVNDIAGMAQGAASLPDAAATAAGKVMSIVPTVLGYHDVAHSLANPVTIGGTVEGIAPTPDTTGGKINRFAGQMLGAGMSMPQSAVDSVLARVFGDAPKPPLPGGPAPLLRAGQQEGVTVPRAMADASVEPKVIATGKTMTGARVMGGGMAKVGNQIQGRVNALGQGGTPLEPYNAGETVQGIGKRFITQSSQAFNRQYDNLRAASENVPIKAQQSLDYIDGLLTRLNKTPETNAKEIKYLSGVKSDIARGLDVQSARDIGSRLASDIRKGDVTFGPMERDVLGLRGAVSSDVASGLTQAGKPNIAAQFKQVDGAYQERMDFVRNTIQKLTGPRNAPLAPEQAASRIQAWARKGGDSAALGKIMAQATPDEQANIAATFADSLGKNGKGEFSTAILANNAQKMPERVRNIIFGADGAKSLENITRLANEHARVTRALGGSPTGLALDARGWVLNTLFGAGGAVADAAAGGGLTSSAIAGAATTAGMAGVKTAKNILSARALMSPKITGWLRSTPRTTDPAAINAWYDRLKGIAAREPALAPEIQRIRDSISNAANSNVTPAAAASGTDQSN